MPFNSDISHPSISEANRNISNFRDFQFEHFQFQDFQFEILDFQFEQSPVIALSTVTYYYIILGSLFLHAQQKKKKENHAYVCRGPYSMHAYLDSYNLIQYCYKP
jgi:hypothetical protein